MLGILLSAALASAQAPCHHPDDTGLEWGLCNVSELRELVAAIRKRESVLARALGPSGRTALNDEHKRLLDMLRDEVGALWYDVVEDDVGAALREHLAFLASVDTRRRQGSEGSWANGRGELRIAKGRATELRIDECDVPTDTPGVTIRREGAAMRVTMTREAYAAIGCPSNPWPPSFRDGLYLPITG
ncbi:MAG: hypothetical protein V4808_02885 [Pseudomonadota bacterium]